MANPNLSRVVECIAKATRYPTKILQPTADLEIDLGIDSVKRLEVVVELEKEFGLALSSQPRDSSIRTIEDIAGWVEKMMGVGQATASTEKPVGASDSLATTIEVQPAKSELPYTETTRNGNGSVADESSLRYDNAQSDFRSRQPEAFAAAKPQASSASGKSLSGKVAFVSGSGRGVGKVIARVLASRGATVIVNSFHSRDAGEQTAAEINGSGGQAVHIWGSIANPGQVDGMFDEIESRFGRLDILICNASNGRIGSFMDITPEDWDKAFRTNVSGHHQCALRAAKLMQRVGGGSIVTMSAVGSQQFIHGLGSQGVVKAAVESMTRYLACELGKFGIRTNCVVGGPIYGDLLSKFPDAEVAQHHWETVCPDGNLTSPLDMANTIAFLLSDEARGINGAIWTVDHGFSAMSSGQPIPKPVAALRSQAR